MNVTPIAGFKSRFSANKDELSCAGQGCPDRERCLRYRRRAAYRDQRWASFDIERQVREDTRCPAFDPLSAKSVA